MPPKLFTLNSKLFTSQKGGIAVILTIIILIIPVFLGGYSALCWQQQGSWWCALDTGFLTDAASDTKTLQETLFKSQTDDSDPATRGWLTYTNQNYGYSIKYPETHKVGTECEKAVEITGCNRIVVSIEPKEAEPFTFPRLVIRSVVKDSTDFKLLSLQEIAQQNFKANQWNSGTKMKNLVEPDTVQFAGERAFHYAMEARKFTGSWETFPLLPGLNYVYEFVHNENYFLLVHSHDIAVEQIAKTLKFTR